MDTRLCFGLRSAPYIFATLSDFTVKCMNRRGISKIFAYLDDYIVIGCQKKQNMLIELLGELDFFVNWSKCSSSSTTCTFL